MALDVETARRRLELYLEAEKKALAGQEYRIGDRTLKRADLSEIRKAIDELTVEEQSLTGVGAGQVRRVVF